MISELKTRKNLFVVVCLRSPASRDFFHFLDFENKTLPH